jgi:hypothetical protein
MRVFALVAATVYFVTFLNVGVFGTSLDARRLSLADVPPCGVSCMLELMFNR